MKKIKIGFLVNPISGVGGPLGLKGSDSKNIWNYVNDLKKLKSLSRTNDMLLNIDKIFCDKFIFLTGSEYMGENSLKQHDFNYKLVYKSKNIRTTDVDTVNLLYEFKEQNVDLILYSGGDGTSVLVQKIIKETIPVIAIPVGVKMYSGIFPISPIHSAGIFNEFINSPNVEYTLREISDLDDTQIINGITSTQFAGYLNTPLISNLSYSLQESKGGSSADEKDEINNLVEDFKSRYSKNAYYLIGPGSTTSSLLKSKNLDGTLLGFDILHNDKLVKTDCSEEDIYKFISNTKSEIYLVITIIGNQGFLFGRGNQQISPRILNELDIKNLLIYATSSKLDSLENDVLIDTGDINTDSIFGNYINIISGYKFTELKKTKIVYL
tara:strand:+ start:77402 stop:78544 length:1143 start_codon:yes stop_codon:yes gene_type:complete